MMNEKRQVELADLDWEDRERVLRLMFSKMNTGQSATNWRIGSGTSGRESAATGGNGRGIGGTGGRRTANDARTSEGMGSKGKLNQSFREEDEEEEDEEGDGQYEYDQEVDDNVSNTNIFRKTNAEEYGGSGSAITTKKGSQQWN